MAYDFVLFECCFVGGLVFFSMFFAVLSELANTVFFCVFFVFI